MQILQKICDYLALLFKVPPPSREFHNTVGIFQILALQFQELRL